MGSPACNTPTPSRYLLLAIMVSLLSACSVQAGGARGLQKNVDNLAFQMSLTFKGNAAEHSRRYDMLSDVLSAWNNSARTDEDFQRMEAWLLASLQASMPGAVMSLPEAPVFSEEIAAAPITVESGQPYHDAETVPGHSVASQHSSGASGKQISSPAVMPQPAVVASDSPAESEREETPQVPPSLDQHPAAAKLVWGDPFVDDPLPRTAMWTTRRKPAVRVSLNVAELQARVNGYRRGLDFLEAELIAEPNASAFRLAGLTREVESLVSERSLLELYMASVPSVERAMLGKLPTADQALALLRSRTEDRLLSVSDSSDRSAEAERAVIDGLEHKLNTLGASIGAEE